MNDHTTMLCDRERSFLAVVDVQTRLMSAMPEASRSAVLGGTSVLLQAAEYLSIPTAITEQYPKGLGRTCPELIDNQPEVCETVEKTAFSASGVEGFDQLLGMSKRTQVIICGVETHVCVLQTALNLRISGVEVFVAADAVCSRDEQNKSNALERMMSAGVHVSNVESIVFEWLGDASHPRFRDVSALIK
ncbi:MAG: isochorismatase family protein [Pseudomonadota bacterium]